MDELNKLRKQIDYYDQELIDIFEKRMKIVLEIMSYKKAQKMPIFQEDREKQMLEKASENISNKSFEPEVQDFFKSIIKISRKLQSRHLFNYNIILIGFMGSGKSSIGKELSRLLEMEWIDTDVLIEKKMNMSINSIFEKYGEDFFRHKEEEVIQRLCCKNNKIISCGGGVVLRKENVENLRKSGKIIFLQAKPETIYQRIKNDTTRPLLKGRMTQTYIEKKLKQRNEYYRNSADFVINTDSKTKTEIAREIIVLLCR